VAVLLDDLVTQRWGVGSTILHRDAGALALGVLLFDRIVLPTPSDEPEADRWDSLGWDTEAQARRIVQLGELVYFAPWTEELRADWQTRWEHLRQVGTEARDLAFAATPQVIAMKAWSDVVASAGESSGTRPRPVPVIWAPGLSGVIDDDPVPRAPAFPYEQLTALHFGRELEQPLRDDPEATLDAALKLANSADFQAARRTLYTAEALAAAGQLTPDEFGATIDAAVHKYNQVVTDYSGATVRRVVHHVIPEAIGQIPMLGAIPGAATAAQWLVTRVLARLLPLPPAPAPALDEGAALAMTERAMAVVSASG
jgi:hypothetical protein